jgi:3D (Asp-Asp-Asp) domain-containing protein
MWVIPKLKIMIMNYNILLSMVMVCLPYEMEREEIRVNKMIETLTPEIVTLTTYKASETETDSTPNITASGFKIDTKNAKRHRIIAVSRDLKKKLKFGSKVRIEGAGKYSGTYVVKDVMNKRYKKRIDILINPDDKQTKLKKIKLYKI